MTTSDTPMSTTANGTGNVDANGNEATADTSTDTSGSYYYDQASHYGMHEEVLKDRTVMKTYTRAILENKHLFQGKTVLHINAGLGILSMMCITAGATHVYAIESSNIYKQLQSIIGENNMASQITVLHSKVEDIDVLPDNVQHVDIILCDWIGYFLFSDTLLDSVIYARDHFANASTIIMPDKVSLYLAGIEDSQYRSEKYDFWDNVYGFQMSSVQRVALNEPLIDAAESKQIMTSSYPIVDIDIYKIKMNTHTFQNQFELTTTRTDTCHALIAYWVCCFSRTHTQLTINTSPRHDYTHYKQTVFYLPQAYKQSHSQHIRGHIRIQRYPHSTRDVDIHLTVSTDQYPKRISQTYRLR
jgi:protein arginine N-methyltransferase 1